MLKQSDGLDFEMEGGYKQSISFIEQWINKVLSRSEYFIKNDVRTKDQTIPLNRFGVNKSSLIEMGLNFKQVERIYRSLFVYSMGFNQMIRQIGKSLNEELNPSKRGKRDFLQINVWRVYQILLEYCNQTEYKMLLDKAETDFRTEINGKNEKLMLLETGNAAKEIVVREKMKHIIKEMKDLEKRKI